MLSKAVPRFERERAAYDPEQFVDVDYQRVRHRPGRDDQGHLRVLRPRVDPGRRRGGHQARRRVAPGRPPPQALLRPRRLRPHRGRGAGGVLRSRIVRTETHALARPEAAERSELSGLGVPDPDHPAEGGDVGRAVGGERDGGVVVVHQGAEAGADAEGGAAGAYVDGGEVPRARRPTRSVASCRRRAVRWPGTPSAPRSARSRRWSRRPGTGRRRGRRARCRACVARPSRVLCGPA